MREEIRNFRKSVSKYLERRREEKRSKALLRNLPKVHQEEQTIFVFLSRRQLNFRRNFGFFPKVYALAGFELARRGYASYYLFDDPLLEPYFPKLRVNGQVISCSIRETIPRVDYSCPYVTMPPPLWNISRGEQRVLIDKFNFFPLITCTIRTIQRRYNVDFTDPETQHLVHTMTTSCALLLSYFRQLQKYATENDKKIRICGWESNYIPNGVFQVLCDQTESEADVHYIDLNRSYIHYFGEYARGANFMSVANLTKKKIVDRKTVTKSELDSVSISDGNFDQLVSSIEKALNKKFSQGQSEEKTKTLQLIEKYRRDGKEIFVLFGHLFYDVGVDDSSPSFSNMCEWIAETIRFFGEQDDLLLLKPHPVEAQKGPQETLYTFSESLICSENIKLLDPLLFNIREVANFISCGLIWRSSVGLELTYLNVPNIIAGTPRYNILDLCYPKDKQHYFQLIENFRGIKFNDQQVRDVIRYVYILEKRKSIEVKQVSSKGLWNKDSLALYMTRGDKELENLVDCILTESK